MSSGPAPLTELSAVNSSGIGLQVAFNWDGDRYKHSVLAIDGAQSRVLLESVEGDDDEGWPTSPPMQHVHVSWIESDSERGHVAMLIGAAGDSHWSMCVAARDCRTHTRCMPNDVLLTIDGTPVTQIGQEDTELFFDVACRAHSAPKFLGSTYWSLGNRIACSNRSNCAFIPADGPGLVILPQNAQLTMELNRAPGPILRCQAMDIRFDESPTTIRWRYSIRRTSGGPLCVKG